MLLSWPLASGKKDINLNETFAQLNKGVKKKTFMLQRSYRVHMTANIPAAVPLLFL